MARLARVKQLYFDFLKQFNLGELDSLKDSFENDVKINFSTVGMHEGVEEVLKALKISNDFDIHYATVADVMEFENDVDDIILAKGHHYVAYRDGAFLYPFLWGGKYEFAVNKESGKISYIKFYLEYEFGNTYIGKARWHWKLYEETKDLKTSIVNGYHQYREIAAETEKEKIQNTIYKLLWDWDNMDYEACLAKVTDDVYIRVRLFEEQGPAKEFYKKEEFKELMDRNLAYEDQTQMSVFFDDIEIDGDKALVHLKRYNPGKVVNKHVDTSTIHKLFFNMKLSVRMIKKDDEWLVKESYVMFINDVDAIGFDFQEIKEGQLNEVQVAFNR